jgi:hypothetical protein
MFVVAGTTNGDVASTYDSAHGIEWLLSANNQSDNAVITIFGVQLSTGKTGMYCVY